MKDSHERQYLNNLGDIHTMGTLKGDRTGTGTNSLHNTQIRADLRLGFPLLTTKKVHLRGIIEENLWFLRGLTNNNYLLDKKVTIWNEWSTKEMCAKFGRTEGDLGAIYGHQWRNFGATPKDPNTPDSKLEYRYALALENANPNPIGYDDTSNDPNNTNAFEDFKSSLNSRRRYDYSYNHDGFDQIAWVIKELISNPMSRRLVVTGWNPSEASQVALPPCHTLFQFVCSPMTEAEIGSGSSKLFLDTSLHQRSGDYFLGIPYNLAGYSFTTALIAKLVNMIPREVVLTIADSHVYSNHQEAIETQLGRGILTTPILVIDPELDAVLGTYHRILVDAVATDKPLEYFSMVVDDIMFHPLMKSENFSLSGYQSHPAISAPVSV